MKSFRFLIAIALIGTLLTYSGCGKDSTPGPSEQDKQLTLLAKPWKATSVTLDGAVPTVPAPANYTYVGNFIFDATNTKVTAGQTNFTYITSGGPLGSKTPWPKSGSFTFGTDFATTLTRDDGFVVSYSVSATRLQMTFNTGGKTPPFTGYDGRTANVSGNWVFEFALK